MVNAIYGPLIATTMFGRESQDEQRRSMAFWADCLSEYSPDEAKAAFVEYAQAGKRFPQAGDIVGLIKQARRGVGDAIIRRVMEEQRQERIKETP